jgi:hypothetical protein
MCWNHVAVVIENSSSLSLLLRMCWQLRMVRSGDSWWFCCNCFRVMEPCLQVEVYNRIPRPLFPHPSCLPRLPVFPPCPLSVGVEEVWQDLVQGDRWHQQALLVWWVFPLQVLHKPSFVVAIVQQLVSHSHRHLGTHLGKLWPQWVFFFFLILFLRLTALFVTVPSS